MKMLPRTSLIGRYAHAQGVMALAAMLVSTGCNSSPSRPVLPAQHSAFFKACQDFNGLFRRVATAHGVKLGQKTGFTDVYPVPGSMGQLAYEPQINRAIQLAKDADLRRHHASGNSSDVQLFSSGEILEEELQETPHGFRLVSNKLS